MSGYLSDAARSGEVLSAIIFLFSFLLGSIPFGLIIARIFKVRNLTHKGSGNIGATNVSRIVGFWPAGFITFFLDASKGVLAVLLAGPAGCHLLSMLLSGDSNTATPELGISAIWIAGFCAILGHCYPPWLHFKGGKGVATALGVILILSPISAVFGLVGFILTFLHRGIVSLASIAGAILVAVAYLVLNPVEAHLWVGAAMLFLVLARHETNIDALLENKEKSFK